MDVMDVCGWVDGRRKERSPGTRPDVVVVDVAGELRVREVAGPGRTLRARSRCISGPWSRSEVDRPSGRAGGRAQIESFDERQADNLMLDGLSSLPLRLALSPVLL